LFPFPLFLCRSFYTSSPLFSSCTFHFHRKYDPSAHIDRSTDSSIASSAVVSDSLFFPDNYLLSTLSRTLSVVKGKGCSENYEKAKEQFYYRPSFSSVKGSNAFQSRMKKIKTFYEIQKFKESHFEKKMEEYEIMNKLNLNEFRIEDVEVGIRSTSYPLSTIGSSSSVPLLSNSWSFLSGSLSEYIIDILPLKTLSFIPVASVVAASSPRLESSNLEDEGVVDQVVDEIEDVE
jgi:hypothetical protein